MIMLMSKSMDFFKKKTVSISYSIVEILQKNKKPSVAETKPVSVPIFKVKIKYFRVKQRSVFYVISPQWIKILTELPFQSHDPFFWEHLVICMCVHVHRPLHACTNGRMFSEKLEWEFSEFTQSVFFSNLYTLQATSFGTICIHCF